MTKHLTIEDKQYELIPFKPKDHPEQYKTYLLKPVGAEEDKPFRVTICKSSLEKAMEIMRAIKESTP